MIKPFFIRSTIFNLCFYVITGCACIILLPTLILPRRYYMAVVQGFVRTTHLMERFILGLDYEIRGAQHVPAEGAYILAAKHQSAYETFKLHILFQDPAIVLKKELLSIPFWGQYLAKSDVIAIDRSSPKIAIKSIQDGAKRVATQGREIIIFPQGTRVAPEIGIDKKPFKIGIVRIQEATDLPIIPMALNTGVFYPKGAWVKKPGRVIFEFLPPILPSKNRDAGETLALIEATVEGASIKLMEEGRASIPKSKFMRNVVIAFIFCTALYSANWFITAHFIKKEVTHFIEQVTSNPNIIQHQIEPPKVSGFPAKVTMHFAPIKLHTHREDLEIHSLTLQGWPFIGLPVDLQTEDIAVFTQHWQNKMIFSNLNATFSVWNNIVNIDSAVLKHEDTSAKTYGTLNIGDTPYPQFNLDLELKNHTSFLAFITQNNVINKNASMIAAMGLQALSRDGVVKTKITSADHKVYLGPIKIMEFPKAP